MLERSGQLGVLERSGRPAVPDEVKRLQEYSMH